jgi:glutathione S-transferase
MKLYLAPVAPNPTRVKTYVAEKGLLANAEIEAISVSMLEGEQRSPQHLARNPSGTLPVLELNDGSFITESLTIMQYLEALYPEPPMIGVDTRSHFRTLEMERKIELGVTNRLVRWVHATNSPLGLPKNKGIEESENRNLPNGLQFTNDLIGANEFVLGDTPTIADCTLFGGLFFAEFFAWQIPAEYSNLLRWYEAFKKRPSAQL